MRGNRTNSHFLFRRQGLGSGFNLEQCAHVKKSTIRRKCLGKGEMLKGASEGTTEGSRWQARRGCNSKWVRRGEERGVHAASAPENRPLKVTSTGTANVLGHRTLTLNPPFRFICSLDTLGLLCHSQRVHYERSGNNSVFSLRFRWGLCTWLRYPPAPLLALDLPFFTAACRFPLTALPRPPCADRLALPGFAHISSNNWLSKKYQKVSKSIKKYQKVYFHPNSGSANLPIGKKGVKKKDRNRRSPCALRLALPGFAHISPKKSVPKVPKSSPKVSFSYEQSIRESPCMGKKGVKKVPV